MEARTNQEQVEHTHGKSQADPRLNDEHPSTRGADPHGPAIQSHRDHPSTLIGEIHSSGVKVWVNWLRQPSQEEAAAAPVALVESIPAEIADSAEFMQLLASKFMTMQQQAYGEVPKDAA